MMNDLVERYHAWRPLYDRRYQDPLVASCVLIINRYIRYACARGNDAMAYSLARILARAEPLEERAIDDDQGYILKWIADLILTSSWRW